MTLLDTVNARFISTEIAFLANDGNRHRKCKRAVFGLLPGRRGKLERIRVFRIAGGARQDFREESREGEAEGLTRDGIE